jgi:hypothetical protein
LAIEFSKVQTVICGRGAFERASFLYLPLDPLNRAAANTKFSSDLQHALAVPQLLTRRLRPLEPRVDPLSDL